MMFESLRINSVSCQVAVGRAALDRRLDSTPFPLTHYVTLSNDLPSLDLSFLCVLFYVNLKPPCVS